MLVQVDFDALKDLDTMYKKFEAFDDDILLLPPPPPAPLSQEEEFQEITERYIGLHMDAMVRLRPVQLRPLLSVNLICTMQIVAILLDERRSTIYPVLMDVLVFPDADG